MTNQSKSVLTALFQTGDVPSSQNYGDMIDSSVNLAETSAQTMIGPLVTTELIAPRVSCANLIVTGTFSAQVFAPINVQTNTVSATAVYADSFNAINATSVIATGNVTSGGDVAVSGNINSGGNATVTGNASITGNITVSGSNNGIYGTSNFYDSVLSYKNLYLNPKCRFNIAGGILQDVSAAGTTQGTATIVSAQRPAFKCAGVVGGSATGFILQANNEGTMQLVWNPSVSANLYPPTGGNINALANNVPLPLPAGSLTLVLHVEGSAYGAIQ